jgi:hypothetical protein
MSDQEVIIDGDITDLTPDEIAVIDSELTEDDLQEAWDHIEQVRGEDRLIYSFLVDDEGNRIKPVCGGHKKNGMPCHASLMTDRNRCRIHGGKSPRGVAHPRFSTGTYSKDVPSRLQAKYEAALKDEKLLELKEETAIVQARIADLLTRVDTGESGETWRQLDKTYNDMRKASNDHNQAKFVSLLNDLGGLIKKGRSDYDAWDEVFRSVKTKQRLAEAEHKRMVALKQTMTAEQANAMVGFIIATIKKHSYEQFDVKSANVLMAAISADLANHLAGGRSPSLLSSGKR